MKRNYHTIKYIKYIKDMNNSRGFYTVEAAIFLPLVILAVMSLGFVIKADSLWEGCMHKVYDECAYSQSASGSGISRITSGARIYKSTERNKDMNFTLTGCVFSYSDRTHTNLNRLTPRLYVNAKFPLEFGHNHKYSKKVKYRDFVGLKYNRPSMGAEGLETDATSSPVWVFPQSGEKYHRKGCTYVTATVHSCTLSASVKKKYSPCHTCNSQSVPSGSIVFCFNGEDTCYHRGSCRSINRHTVTIDKTEAEKKGYTPCSKCGG